MKGIGSNPIRIAIYVGVVAALKITDLVSGGLVERFIAILC